MSLKAMVQSNAPILAGKTPSCIQDELLPFSGMIKGFLESSMFVGSDENADRDSVTNSSQSSNQEEMTKKTPSIFSSVMQVLSETATHKDIINGDIHKGLGRTTGVTSGRKSERTSSETFMEMSRLAAVKISTSSTPVLRKESSLKRARSLLSVAELGDLQEKKLRLITAEAITPQQTMEISATIIKPTTDQDALAESSSGETEAETTTVTKSSIPVSEHSATDPIEETRAMISQGKVPTSPLTDTTSEMESSSTPAAKISRKKNMLFETPLTENAAEVPSKNTPSEYTNTEETEADVLQVKTSVAASIETGVDKLTTPSPQKELMQTTSAIGDATLQNLIITSLSPTKMLAKASMEDEKEEQCSICGKTNCPLVLNMKSKNIFTKISVEDKTEKEEICSLCGRTDCPLVLNRRPNTSVPYRSNKSLLGKMMSQSKGSASKPPILKSRRVKVPSRRSIGTRSEAKGLLKRIANHSPLHALKLKVK